MFAMFSIVLIGRNDDIDGDEDTLESKNRFKYTLDAMVCLFQLMTLDEWIGIVYPLMLAAWWTYFWFLLYISIAGLALMNMVT